nr:MAG TPA_asm: hypothetical protein [Caudoviricetes sp.]
MTAGKTARVKPKATQGFKTLCGAFARQKELI